MLGSSRSLARRGLGLGVERGQESRPSFGIEPEHLSLGEHAVRPGERAFEDEIVECLVARLGSALKSALRLGGEMQVKPLGSVGSRGHAHFLAASSNHFARHCHDKIPAARLPLLSEGLFPFWEHDIYCHEGHCPKHARRLLEQTPGGEGCARTLVQVRQSRALDVDG